ncbi:MAG: nucleotidyltransferase domain-containing protein [Candidatus Aenigmatarchaeota archaeon]
MYNTKDLFGNRICWTILNFFIANPSIEISQTQIIKTLNISKLSAIKWLKFLEQKKIIIKKQIGRTNLYTSNKENSIVKQIKILNNVANIIEKLPETEADIYLYGSASRGENDEKSDIDILVIGKDRSIIDRIKKLDNRTKVSFFTPTKWSQMIREDPAFYERVEKDKIRLML